MKESGKAQSAGPERAAKKARYHNVTPSEFRRFLLVVFYNNITPAGFVRLKPGFSGFFFPRFENRGY